MRGAGAAVGMGRVIGLVALGCAAVLLVGPTAMADRAWNGTSGLWSDPNKWVPSGVPGDGEAVTLPAGNYTNMIDSPSSNLLSFTQNGGVLLFTNWTTVLRATEVVLHTGLVTHALCDTNAAPDNTNRVWIIASNLTVGLNAGIVVDFQGFRGGPGTGGAYTNGQGPGGGILGTDGTAGGSYGGKGGDSYYSSGYPGPVYGTADSPLLPGSGGAGRLSSYGGNGGGAVRLDLSGRLTVNGRITANGAKGLGCGSGGSIYITCSTVAGTGGLIRADGGNLSGNEGGTVGGGGGGGRVAIFYNSSQQSQLPAPAIRFSAAHGCGDPYYNQAPNRNGYPGTVLFTDWRLMPTNLYDRDGGQFLVQSASLSLPEFVVTSSNRIHTSSTTPNDADNTWVILPDIRQLTVSGRMVIMNGSRVDMTNCVTRVGTTLTVTNRALWYVMAGETNGIAPAYGALVAVTNDMLVADGSWIYPISHWTNGGSVLFQMRNLTVGSTNSGFNADGFGYGSHTQYPNIYTNVGYGPGGGGYRSGGGYGGRGGGSYPGVTYGNTNAPTQCGSGGGYQQNGLGYWGGGLVWIQASGAVSLEGQMTARGSSVTPVTQYIGAGSGGGIFIRCASFSGGSNALLSVDGGYGGSYGAGGGGGGRIAVWYGSVSDWDAEKIMSGQLNQVAGRLLTSSNHPSYLGSISVKGGGGATGQDGLPGTAVFLSVDRRGMLIMLR